MRGPAFLEVGKFSRLPRIDGRDSSQMELVLLERKYMWSGCQNQGLFWLPNRKGAVLGVEVYRVPQNRDHDFDSRQCLRVA